MGKIRIDLVDRSYDIHVGCGLLSKAGDLISSACHGRSAAIVTNERIGNLYGGQLVESLERAGISAHTVTVPAGERYKTLRTVARIYEGLLDKRLDRQGIVIGLGGGVVGDMAGFVAATYLRGIDFVQIPTSLLAQVDASVGGKTGVNLSRGKNLVGAFHQPRLVVIDVSVLRSLPRRELRSGLAEVIKHGIIRDAEYLTYVAGNLDGVKHLDPNVLERIVERSCEIKAEVVRQDERESGLRRILNYGHTAGHAIESLTGYRRYKHGEAVAIGMVTAALTALEIGAADESLPGLIVDILKASGLPYKPPETLSSDDIVKAMQLDKKVASGELHAVIVDSIGSTHVVNNIPADAWLSALEAQAML